MILVNVVMLHSPVMSCCRLTCVTETTTEHTDSFSTRVFQATDTIPNAKLMNFGSKHCSELWPNDRAPEILCLSFAANTVSLSNVTVYTRLLIFDS